MVQCCCSFVCLIFLTMKDVVYNIYKQTQQQVEVVRHCVVKYKYEF